MGVRGLTTFIANRSRQYLEHYELHDSHVVIDGNSVASQLYKWHCRCNDCFGGDYDKFANVIVNFFQLLNDCNVIPLVVLDGAYEKRKMKTVYSRIRNKVGAAKALDSVTEGNVSLFPLFLRDLFVDILYKMNVQCVRCDFEGDNDTALLARTLKCPLMSYDSDFYIFDVLYLPFSHVDLTLRRKKEYSFIACEVYRVEKFLHSFGGLDKVNLPLLGVLLGNDYIKKRAFRAFYRQLKLYKTKHNEQQTQIKSVIMWLRNETPDSALRKILGRYKMRARRNIAKRIQNALEAYQLGNTPVCSYFKINESVQPETNITVPDPEEVENCSEPESDNESDSSSESMKEEEMEENVAESKFIHKYDIPDFFRENFRKALYPPCFMDILVSNTCFCVQQMEDFQFEHSHSISVELLAAITKILTYPKNKRLICVSRNRYAHVKRFVLPLYEKDVPPLTDIENMVLDSRNEVFFKILNVEESVFSGFPKSWKLFLVSLKYWVTNSKLKIDLAHIYSLVMCAIITNYVDSKIGFYRSTKSFMNKYQNCNTVGTPTNPSNIQEAFNAIDENDGVSCMKKLIYYFQMEEKMKSNNRLFDRKIVHYFAEFQSCLLHVKHLNCLLSFPLDTLAVSDFYDGTFLYNMTVNLRKRGDIGAYVKILLKDTPKILEAVEIAMREVEEQMPEGMGKGDPPKRRRKRKKSPRKTTVEDMNIDSDEGEVAFDENNKFTVLSFVNK